MTSKTDEAALIGGFEMVPIVIRPYDPAWAGRYASQAGAIRAALGKKLLRVEHVGSTAVPELAAKPIIDILIVVADSADESSYVPQLKAAGYELRVREPDFDEHRMLRTPKRDVHIHAFSPGAAEIERLLAFRDRLRVNATDRIRYEDTKRRLAARSWPDMNAYAEAKTEVIEQIIEAARHSSIVRPPK
jgi:GrpB-like predicted nucleotidyltransferase (UPF0157 family)